MNYQDFVIHLDSRRGNTYRAHVLSPAGETIERIIFPYFDSELTEQLLILQNAIMRSGKVRRRILTSEMQIAQSFGQTLFNSLFSGEIRSLFDTSLNLVTRDNEGLRLKLCIESPELTSIPWEYMFDPRRGSFLALSRRTPIVRYIELPQPIQPLTVVSPLRILGVISSPGDLSRLNISHEKDMLKNAVEEINEKRQLDLSWLENNTWSGLQREMRKEQWHILHFVGHGSFDTSSDEGVIAFVDENQQSFILKASQLADLLADHNSLRLVLLNICESGRSSLKDSFSSIASTLLRRGIPSVLAMQYEITDDAAIEFTKSFYSALVDRLPIDAAVAEARKGIKLKLQDSLEWGTPVLYMRSTSGNIFDTSENADDQNATSTYEGIQPHSRYPHPKDKKQTPTAQHSSRQTMELEKVTDQIFSELLQVSWQGFRNLPKVFRTISSYIKHIDLWLQSQGTISERLGLSQWMFINIIVSSIFSYIFVRLFLLRYEFGTIIIFALIFGITFSVIQWNFLFRRWRFWRSYAPSDMSEEKFWWLINSSSAGFVGLVIGGITYDLFGNPGTSPIGFIIGGVAGIICGLVAGFILGKFPSRRQ